MSGKHQVIHMAAAASAHSSSPACWYQLLVSKFGVHKK
jgi:hypothetical protein